MSRIILIAHNLRSTHNVGSLLRTADGLGIEKVYLTGYTPYPAQTSDRRLPHLASKINRDIQKTALGAEKNIAWEQADTVDPLLDRLTAEGWFIAALEQAAGSQPLPLFRPPEKLAIIVGREVEGLEPEILAMAKAVLEIPMFGQKESFNVVQAAAMALYHCRFKQQLAAT